MLRVFRNSGSDGSYIRCGSCSGAPKRMCHRNILVNMSILRGMTTKPLYDLQEQLEHIRTHLELTSFIVS